MIPQLLFRQYSRNIIGVVVAAVLVWPISVMEVRAQSMEGASSDELAKFTQQMNEIDNTRRKTTLDDITFQPLDSKSSSLILPLLKQALQDRDLGVRGRAARAMSQLPPLAFPVLLELSKDQNPNVRMGAAAAITELEVPASAKIPILLKALQDQNPGVRMQAVWGVGRLGPEAREAIAILAEIAKDNDVDARIRAIYALQHIGWKVKEAVPPLGLALADPEEIVRLKAARALVAIGPNAVVVLPAIRDGLQVQNPLFQGLLIEVLDTLGPDALPAIPSLLNMLKSSSVHIRGVTVKALKRIEGDSLPSLREAALGNDSTLRFRALEVLLRLGALGKNGLPTATAVESELIGVFGPDTDFLAASLSKSKSSGSQTGPTNDRTVCQHIQQLRNKNLLQFDYPNYDGPDSFLPWVPWRWLSDRGNESEFFGMEVDIDGNGNQELLIKWWHWGPHMYHRAEGIYVLSGKDLSPYFMRFEDIRETTIGSTSFGENPIYYDRSLSPHAVPGITDTVSEYARINPFTFKKTNYFLVDEGELIVGKYRPDRRLEVVCYLPQTKAPRKKRS